MWLAHISYPYKIPLFGIFIFREREKSLGKFFGVKTGFFLSYTIRTKSFFFPLYQPAWCLKLCYNTSVFSLISLVLCDVLCFLKPFSIRVFFCLCLSVLMYITYFYLALHVFSFHSVNFLFIKGLAPFSDGKQVSWIFWLLKKNS